MRLFIVVALLVGALLVACQANGEETLDPIAPTNVDRVYGSDGYILNELLVKFVDDPSVLEIEKLLNEYEAFRINENFYLGGFWVVWVPEKNLADLLQSLQNHPDVDYAERHGFATIP